MKEKIFLFLFLILIIASFIVSDFPRSLLNEVRGEFLKDYFVQQYPLYIKGVYLTSWTAGNSKKIDYFLELVKQTELNAVVIDIKEVDGRVAFDTNSSLINDLGTEQVMIPDIKKVIEKFHRENVYVIARIVVFKDEILPKIKPELALKNRQAGLWRDWAGRTWLDMASKEVWDYHVELAKEAIRVGFDEINFDYVRFPSDGDISQIVYPIWDGKTPKPEIMRRFFEYLNQELKPLGVFLSADLFGLVLWNESNNDMNIGQILEYALPYFDFICPMVYPSHYPPDFEGYANPAAHPYEIIKMNLEKGKGKMNDTEAKLRPWLQDFSLGAIYDKEMIELQKQAVYDTDSYGWLLWNPASRYTEEALERN